MKAGVGGANGGTATAVDGRGPRRAPSVLRRASFGVLSLERRDDVGDETRTRSIRARVGDRLVENRDDAVVARNEIQKLGLAQQVLRIRARSEQARAQQKKHD